MEVLHLHEVDSTSTYAAQLLAQGKQAPFLVHADTQNGGRGRRGNKWESLKGNLFLTIALPAEQIAPAQNGLLPLKAGVVFARLLQQQLGLRVTLKWPNDLLFGGRKLGGLLLESSVSGGQFGDLLIGFGLNCAHAPTLAGAYGATCLQEILGRPVAAAALAAVIAAGFVEAWQRLPIDAVLDAHADFAIAPGHVFCHDQAGLATLVGLSADGGLRLTQSSSAELALTSADHGWRWLHQGSAAQKAPLLVADVGNSAIKIACFEDPLSLLPERLERWAYDEPEAALSAALQRLLSTPAGLPWPLFIASVRPQGAAQLSAIATGLGLLPRLLAKRAVRCIGKGYQLTEIGMDRLAGSRGLA